LSQAYLEGTYSEIYPEKSEDVVGLQRFFKQFSFPGGIGSHATPETPRSIHEGGELGYSISHVSRTGLVKNSAAPAYTAPNRCRHIVIAPSVDWLGQVCVGHAGNAERLYQTGPQYQELLENLRQVAEHRSGTR
jgi:hypothetical protein